MMKFPITVEVSLVINSERGWTEPPFNGRHQCWVLHDAFEASWVA